MSVTAVDAPAASPELAPVAEDFSAFIIAGAPTTGTSTR